MIKKIILYLNTIHHIKLSQLYFRLKRKLKLKCKLTNKIKLHKYNNINAVPSIYMLDFDYLFLKKFNVKDLLNDKITLLNESEKLNFNSVWNFSIWLFINF